MAFLTSLILAAFVGYIGAWYFGAVEGNFALLLFLATVVTGLYWLAERLYFLPQRRRRPPRRWKPSLAQRRAELADRASRQVDSGRHQGPRTPAACSRGGWTGPRACSR